MSAIPVAVKWLKGGRAILDWLQRVQGTHPGSKVAENAVAVMAEIGIDISQQSPNHIDEIDHTEFDKVFSMGCGVSCPNIPLDGDWELDDPVGQSMDVYRSTRDAIESNIRSMML